MFFIGRCHYRRFLSIAKTHPKKEISLRLFPLFHCLAETEEITCSRRNYSLTTKIAPNKLLLTEASGFTAIPEISPSRKSAFLQPSSRNSPAKFQRFVVSPRSVIAKTKRFCESNPTPFRCKRFSDDFKNAGCRLPLMSSMGPAWIPHKAPSHGLRCQSSLVVSVT